MRLGFLSLPPEERRLFIEQAALRRNVSPVVLEKDFWVCWLLGNLFESEFADNLVFKGGTSLSKVFGVIERFSEDIDLSVSPAFLKLPAAGTSRNQANKWMAKAEAACGAAVRNQIGPAIEAAVEGVLGRSERVWFEFLADPHTKSPMLLFHYPSSQPAGFDYLKRSVRLEFGSLTDQQPVGRHPIRPWIAEVMPDAFHDWRCEVVALEVERSFWEKATILHAEYHRPAEKPTPDRFSRHYADTAALVIHRAASRALEQHDLRNRVVEWKSQFFGSSWANYDEAKPGTFRLVPPSGACLPYDVITWRCGTCISLSRPASMMFSRSWPTWKTASTTRTVTNKSPSLPIDATSMALPLSLTFMAQTKPLSGKSPRSMGGWNSQTIRLTWSGTACGSRDSRSSSFCGRSAKLIGGADRDRLKSGHVMDSCLIWRAGDRYNSGASSRTYHRRNIQLCRRLEAVLSLRPACRRGTPPV